MKASIVALAAALVAKADAFAYIDEPGGGIARTAGTKNSVSISAEPDAALLQQHSEFACRLADAARKEILPYWRRNRNDLGQEIKVEEDRSEFQSASPVTLADRAAERAMRELIEENFPDHGIYGEEYGIKNADADWVWVLDPIDGTRSFITGKPLFGTLISATYKGQPVIGIIDQCVLNERWMGIKGRESTLNGRPIQTDGTALLSDAEMYSTTPDMFKKGEEEQNFDAMRRSVRTPHYGADCYAYALVASGYGADIVVEADLGLYDYCALVPVLEGAGGVISDWAGRSLTLQNHETSKGRVLASANEGLHTQALEILSKPVNGNDEAAVGLANDDLHAILEETTPQTILSEPSSSVTPLVCGVVIGEVIAHLGL